MKILLIDDHKLFALSIQTILKQYEKIKLVDIISKKEELDAINVDDYDIFLVDINLTNISEESGLDLAEKLLEHNKNISVVILTGYVKLMYERRANRIGAKGFVDKNIDPEELIKVLNEIHNGKKYFKNIKTEENLIEKLTSQEIKILSLLRKGKSIEEIAKEIFISRRTVFNHLNNIYSKLYVNNRQEALYKAEKLGYFVDFF